VDRGAPVGLTDIALTFELDTDADAATVQRLVEMSARVREEGRAEDSVEWRGAGHVNHRRRGPLRHS
jgi:hypothetical protein